MDSLRKQRIDDLKRKNNSKKKRSKTVISLDIDKHGNILASAQSNKVDEK